MKPLLLHACCGPCSLEPVRLLREEGYEPTILWSNPNIQPVAEHDLRLRTLLGWARDVAHVEVVVAAAAAAATRCASRSSAASPASEGSSASRPPWP